MVDIITWYSFYTGKLFYNNLTFDKNSPVIKTHGRVSVAKKDMWHTSVLFTGSTKSLFSYISKTAGPISVKFMYFMPFVYTI